jgi:hypothetical protein
MDHEDKTTRPKKMKTNIITITIAVLALSIAAQQSVLAKGGATDPIPGTSKSGVSSGGSGGGGTGGGKSTTPAPAPTPTPVPTQPALAAGTITFTASGPVNGVLPVCTGDFNILPYYPTLLDMTVNVSVSSMNVPDGTVLYVNLAGANGTLYPYSSNMIVITGGSGSCSEKAFVTLGGGLAGVIITDASGNPVFAGN